MRTIKFRGKRVDNGEWVVGYYFEPPSGQEYLGKCWITPINDKSVLRRNHNVDPATVGQFINVHDASDEEREVFENDQIRFLYELEDVTAYVKIEAGTPILVSDSLPDGFIPILDIALSDRDHFWLDGDAKVVGNIHDNPDLIGGSGK
jgi:uncharacterized phage protein (TIGR01671 family)